MIGKTNSKTGGERGENLNITLTSNQTDKSDLIGATVTVSYGDLTVEQVWNGSVIVVKVPQYVDYTVTVSAVEGYSQPSPYSSTASNQNNSLPLTFTYNTEIVSVTLAADNNSSVNGAKVTINGKSHTWNGSAITQKVPFGTTYSVVPQALSGYSTPASQTGITASQSSRNLSFTYIASALKVNILSNQDNDLTIASVKATVSYGSTSVEVSNGEQVNVPANTAVTITFPEVENYKTPDPISFTHTGGQAEKTGTYQCEILTVNVTADSGTPTGFEVTISKQETVGVSTKYTKLEYIESNGTQYIDTGFKPNNNTRVVMDAQFVSSPTTLNALFGARTSATSKNYAFIHTNQGVMRSDYDNVYTQTWESVGVERFVVDKNKETTTLHNESQSYTNSTFQCDYNMYLCALNNAGSVSWYSSIRLYSCQIYDNGTLVRDYVPALRSDGIAGLYDIVNDTFYASNGSSNFTAGTKSEEVIVTQTSVTGSYKIPFDASYTVQASKVSGYDTPASVTHIASAKSYTVTQEYKVITVRDLSLMDVYGNPINQSTANCYVVREAGQYKFPLVFGNAIKNGKVNTAAFTNNGSTYSHDFVDVDGHIISTPYMEFNSENYSTLRVYVCNKDTDEVVSNVTIIPGTPCGYIQFDVLQVPSEGANVIIAAYVNDGDYIGWSWHIWLWPHDLSPVEITNSTGVKYNIMPVNLASKYDSDGVHIKNWFYQWGRMTPMLCPASYNSSSNHSPGTITTTSKAANISEGISRPTTFFYNSTGTSNWFGTQSYYNLWDAACTVTGNSDNDTVKTVYDPCPVGWKIPNGVTFTGLSVISSANGIVKVARYSGDTMGVGFPLSGTRKCTDGSFEYVGTHGFVWLSSANSQLSAYAQSVHTNSVSRLDRVRAFGYSVRAVEDEITDVDSFVFNFKIDETASGGSVNTYQAEIGMTWEEWVVSDYNTNNFVLYEDLNVASVQSLRNSSNTNYGVSVGINEAVTGGTYVFKLLPPV